MKEWDRNMRNSLDRWLTTPPDDYYDEEEEPPIDEFDPGPECDDEGGMSEWRRIEDINLPE